MAAWRRDGLDVESASFGLLSIDSHPFFQERRRLDEGVNVLAAHGGRLGSSAAIRRHRRGDVKVIVYEGLVPKLLVRRRLVEELVVNAILHPLIC